MPITKELALTLTYRQELYHVSQKGKDKRPIRCRVNGKVKTWKRNPERFQIPVKYGLKECFYIDNFATQNCYEWSITEGLDPFREDIAIAVKLHESKLITHNSPEAPQISQMIKDAGQELQNK